jgi:hypothetical protein
MKASYGVLWQENGVLQAGKLELEPLAVRLESTGAQGESLVQELPYRELVGVRIARGSGDRLEGRPTLVLERAHGPAMRVASVAQTGIISELAEQLSSLKLAANGAHRVAVIVPFKPEHRAAVQELVEAGPPFDPELAALEQHDVFLTEREAVFIFEGADGDRVLARIVAQPNLWKTALTWRKYLNGKPRIARQAYRWTHSELD